MPTERISKNGRFCLERQHNGMGKNTAKDCSQNKRKKPKLGKIFGLREVNLLLGGGSHKDPQHQNCNFPGRCIRVCYNNTVITSGRETMNGNF